MERDTKLIKFLKKSFSKARGKMFKSLRVGMFMAIVLSIILAVGCAFLTNTIFKNWIENKYNFFCESY